MHQATQTNNPASSNAPAQGISKRESIRLGFRKAGLQLAGLIIVTILFAILDLDRTISAHFFDPVKRWYLAKAGLWKFLYQYGTLPGAVLSIGCLLAWLISFFNNRLAAWRPYFLLALLTTVVAAGILVNSVFKSYWGRPRPNQTTDFGGYYTYRHVFPPGIPGKGASFPCGHCAMGFTFLSLYFFKRQSKATAYGGVAAGLVLGGLLSAARIVQGAHFMTDVIWSMGMVTITAVVLHYCVLKIPAASSSHQAPRLSAAAKMALILAVCIAVGGITTAFMTRRPFFKTISYSLPIDQSTNRIHIEVNIDPEKMLVLYEDGRNSKLLMHAHGFGWAYVDYRIKKKITKADELLQLQFQVIAKSYFSELDHTVEILLPSRLKDRLDISLQQNQQLVIDEPAD